MLHRRSFVSTLALAAAGAIPLGRAHALSFEDRSAAIDKLRTDRCSVASEHATLLAEAEAALAAQHVDATRKAEILAALTCPLCGCHPAALVQEK